MPEVIVKYPKGLFTPKQKKAFVSELKQTVAHLMDAVDPDTGEATKYGRDSESFIDLTMWACDERDFSATTICLVTVVTYEWPDRMVNIHGRLQGIASMMMPMVPRQPLYDGLDAISVTFIGKQPGCWAVA